MISDNAVRLEPGRAMRNPRRLASQDCMHVTNWKACVSHSVKRFDSISSARRIAILAAVGDWVELRAFGDGEVR